MRRSWPSAIGVLGVVGLLAPTAWSGADSGPQLVPVIDLHVDLSYQVNYRRKSIANGSGQFRADWLRSAGVVGVLLPLYIPNDVSEAGPRQIDLEASYATVFAGLARTDPYRLPGCPTGLDQGVSTWLAFEGSAPLARDERAVWRWVARGVRVFGLVHQHHNGLAASSSDSVKAEGLTPAGREFIEVVHRAGGIIDVSHASDRVVDEVVTWALARGAPVIATHSNARALVKHDRNLDDGRLAGIASTGGIVGINFHSRYLSGEASAEMADVIGHLERAIRVAGANHVALGSDFEGGIRPPPELSDVRGFQRLAQALLARGWKRQDVARVFSENARRVLCGTRRSVAGSP